MRRLLRAPEFFIRHGQVAEIPGIDRRGTRRRFNAATITALVAALFATAAMPASAQSRIGAATEVKNQVNTFRKGSSVRLDQGSSVFRSEAVSTGKASAARLTFLDDTNLAIGPSSRVVLDEFVFSQAQSTQALTINLARGAFRFSTGRLDKRAYKIRTSTATIGVRGTVLDIYSGNGRTLVTLVDNGAALLCVTGSQNCRELTAQGQTFMIDPSGVRRTTARRSRFTFTKYCTGSICRRTRLAQRDDNVAPPPGAPPIRRVVQQLPEVDRIPQPDVPTHGGVQATAGVITGIVRDDYGSATWFRNIAVLPSTFKTPLVTGDTVDVLLGSDTAGGVTISSEGPLRTTITVDPGFKYTAWGEWNGTVYSSFGGEGSVATVQRGLAVFGNPTSPETLAAKTGTAVYSGPVLADYSPVGVHGFGAVQPGAVGGTVNITADFGKRTVSGNMDLTLNGKAWAAPVFTSLPMSTTGSIGRGVSYEGSMAAVSGSAYGSLEGAFLGPNGEETAGRFEFLKSSGTAPGGASGIFRAKQGDAH